MRVRYGLPVVAALALGGVAGLHFAHPHIFPRAACASCHGSSIHDPAIMAASAGLFTGPDACEPCHATIYHTWARSSTHCRSMMCPDESTVFAHFSPDTVSYTIRGFTTKMVSSLDGWFMVVPEPDGAARRHRIDLIIGVRDQQAFLTKFPDGRYQILPTAYDILNGTWFDATEGLVRSDHPLGPDDPYYWTSLDRMGNRDCFTCHASGVEKGFDPIRNTYDTKWRDIGVDCEACHGPGRAHARRQTVSWWRRRLYRGDDTLVRRTDLSPRRQVEVCGDCHARKSALATGYAPGKDFYEYNQLSLLSDYLVMPDGRYWGGMHAMLALMESPCYEKGGMTCTHCHDPHGSSQRSGIRESFAKNPDGMCLPCHADLVRDPKPHTFHKADGAGSRCLSCHMEFLPASRLHIADHTISIPVPENTVRFGTPNACNGCHADSTAESMARRLNAWYGPDRRDRWTRAEVLYRAKALDTSAVVPLIRMLGDTAENMVWRANAAFMLGGFGDPRAVEPIARHVRDADPLLRFNAVYALAKFDHPRVDSAFEAAVFAETNPLLRQEMAGRLGWWWRDDLGAREREVANETWKAYVRRVNDALTDWPSARTDLGGDYFRRGEYAAAEREYRIALRIDARQARAEDGLSELYTATGNLDRALQHSRRAVEIEPDNPLYRTNLAATLGALGRYGETETELRRVLAAAPDFTIARKNLGYLFAIRKMPDSATREFREAVSRDPRDAHAHYLYGVSSMEIGRRAEAAQAFANALALAPDAPFAEDARGRLSALTRGRPIPAANVRPGPPPYRPPARLDLDPRKTWPRQTWKSYRPRTTPAEVRRLPVPSGMAGLDSARAWLDRADAATYPEPVRRAFAERALAEIDRYRSATPASRSVADEVDLLRGLGLAVRSTYVPRAQRARVLADAERALSAVDTSRARGDARRALVGGAWYRLGRALIAAKEYRRAIPAFATAARLAPGSWVAGNSWYFAGASYDRIGERDRATAAYERAISHPRTSALGRRGARHGLAHPFRFALE